MEVTIILLSVSDLYYPTITDGKTVSWTAMPNTLKCYVSIHACSELFILNFTIKGKEFSLIENQFLSSLTKINGENIYFKY